MRQESGQRCVSVRFKLALLGLTLLVVGCITTPKMLPHVSNLTTDSSKVVVIGRFELYPPVIAELEQNTHWNVVGDDVILNTVLMATGSSKAPVATNMKMSEWQAAIKTQWGKPFAVEMPRHRTWERGAMMQLDVLYQDRLWFPGGVYFDVPETAKVIYIGTLRYMRNDFNSIVGMDVLDEYDRTLSVLNIDTSKHQIVKSLLKFEGETKPDGYLALNRF